jgi:integrase/ribosomal protein L37AE/L43A
MAAGECPGLPQAPKGAYSAKRVKNGKSAKQSRSPRNSKRCPECGSTRLYRDGLRYLKDDSAIQRWLCRDCSRRFSKPALQPQVKVDVGGKILKGPHPQADHADRLSRRRDLSFEERLGHLSLASREDVGSHNPSQSTIVEKPLNKSFPYYSGYRVCASKREAKNLAKVMETRQEIAQREGTAQAADIKGKIVEFLWHLKKEAYSPRTIEVYGKRLRQIAEDCDISNPENVKEYVGNKQTWNNSTKLLTVEVYKTFANFTNIPFKPPKYRQEEKIPFIPTEKELDALIAGSGKKTSSLLQLLKETGMRIGEAKNLTWTEIDLENLQITLNHPEKNGKPRVFKISPKLSAMLNALPKDKEGPFRSCQTNLYRNFESQRKQLANKLQNSRLLRITFHTFRHWKATMEYHKTKDILHVMQLLGHRNIKNTLVYTQLVNFESDDYHSATAGTVEEARKLVETGFEYVCTHNDIMLFRKRK